MRTAIALLAFVTLASLAWPTQFRGPATALVTPLTMTPVPLDPVAPGHTRVGQLRFVEGWALSSKDPRFGGISALHVAGGRARAISDAGWEIEFALPGGPDAGSVAIARLAATPGNPSLKENRDSEAMAVAGDAMWVAFEQRNAVFRYDADGRISSARPRAMRDWGSNSGAEAMVRLSDGRFLIFSEGGGRADGTTAALLFEGDPAHPQTRSIGLRYRPPAGFSVTDAALLPDGRLLTLARRYRFGEGVSVKLMLADPPLLKPGAIIAGREIAVYRPPLTVDNFEALSVAPTPRGIELWIASDDNYNPLQRTLLLRFMLDGRAPGRPEARP